MNPISGEISTLRRLNLEGNDSSQYHLILLAEDGAATLAQPNKAFAAVVIHVGDINDGIPYFIPNSYNVTIVEGSGVSNFIMLQVTLSVLTCGSCMILETYISILQAIDPDQTTNIVYELRNHTDGGLVNQFFTIDYRTGVISSGAIDYHKDFTSITLDVLAIDNGGATDGSSNTGTATVMVTIQVSRSMLLKVT